jgi:serine protease AprX
MAQRFRIIAHAMHETEILAAERIISDGRKTKSFVTGEADEKQIQDLKAAGLIVQTIAALDDQGRLPPAQPETPGGMGARTFGFNRPTAFTTESLQIAPALEQPDLNRANVYLIHLKGPLLDEWNQTLEGLGVHLMQSYGDNCYSAFLREDQRARVNALDFVAQTTLYGARQTAPGALAGPQPLGAPAPQPGVRQMKTYDVRLHRSEDSNTVLTWLQQHNVAVAGAAGRKIRIYLLEGSPVLGQVAALPEVQRFEEYVPPKLFNDRARALMHVDNPGGNALPYDGTGEIVGVADTGVDDTHPDFGGGRIIRTIPVGRPGVTDDPHGHGTHVCGSILGNGTAAGGSYKGTAPAAKLVCHSLLNAQGGLTIPLDLGTMFDEAYQLGVRIHNDSWGAATKSTYTINSGEVDDYVHTKRDMLIVIAAGNEGSAANNRKSPPGTVDWLSLRSPSTAKNALTVGASRTDRTSGGCSTMTWQQWNTNIFPDPPIGTQKVSGDPESLAGFSSRGPSDDRRIKPDVVAPGTEIISTKSSKAAINNGLFWGPVSGHPEYAYLGGTSMATPLVSGCAALVRQYYRQNGNAKPSAALLRATIVNGTRWLKGLDSNASNPSNPSGALPQGNYDQGFGCVDLQTTLPNSANPNFELVFIDNWQDQNDFLNTSGDGRRYSLKVGNRSMLRVCLAYTDVPGRGLQNNLNLFVQAPDGTKYVGNDQLRDLLDIPDRDNNVEVVRIPKPAAGNYLIQVSATNILQKGQDFALVVTGDLSGAKLQPL